MREVDPGEVPDGAVKLVAGVPDDMTRIPAGKPLSRPPQVDDTAMTCPYCGQRCWVSPKKREYLDGGAATLICWPCIYEVEAIRTRQGARTPMVGVNVQPGRPNRPRVMGPQPPTPGGPLHIVTCKPVDTGRLAAVGFGAEEIAKVIPLVDDTLTTCQACGSQCWIGPRQLGRLKAGTVTALCWLCCLDLARAKAALGLEPLGFENIDPGRVERPRKT